MEESGNTKNMTRRSPRMRSSSISGNTRSRSSSGDNKKLKSFGRKVTKGENRRDTTTTRRNQNKDCDGQSCEDLTEMNPGSQNHGKKSKSHHNNEKRNKKYEDGGEGEYKKYDKKKAKDGVYEKKSKNKDCDGQSCKDWTETNPGSQNHGKKSKSHHNYEKRNKKYED